MASLPLLFILLCPRASLAQPIPAPDLARALELVCNQYRVKNGLPPLEINAALTEAASRHAADMLLKNSFSHESPDQPETTVRERVESTGLTPQSVAENIYGSEGFPAEVLVGECLKAWTESEGHRQNLLNPNYTLMGIAVAHEGGTFRVTQVFAGGDLAFEKAVVQQDSPHMPTSVKQLAEQIFDQTNQQRRENGLSPLKLDNSLRLAAESHSQEMLTLRYFSHESPNPGHHRVRQRVQAGGSNPIRLAENIYHCENFARDTVAQHAVTSLMASPGHRANILQPKHSRMGIGVFEADGQFYVTQVFAGDS